VFCDVPNGREERGYGNNSGGSSSGSGPGSGSLCNEAEASAVVAAVARLLRLRVPARDIGVIVPFRAQAKTVRAGLERVASDAWFRGEFIGSAHATHGAGAGRAGGPLYGRKPVPVDTAEGAEAEPVPAAEKTARAGGAMGDGSEGAEFDPRDVLVSTVDAFQGGEREVIVMSCVKTGDLGGGTGGGGGGSSGGVDSFIENRNRLCVSLSRARRHLIVFGRAATLAPPQSQQQVGSAGNEASSWRAVLARARSAPRGYYRGPQDLIAFLDQCARLPAGGEQSD
jgi:hypothetical protein